MASSYSRGSRLGKPLNLISKESSLDMLPFTAIISLSINETRVSCIVVC